MPPEELPLKDWNQECLILAILVKKFGKNGFLEIDLNQENSAKSLSISVKGNKILIYAE